MQLDKFTLKSQEAIQSALTGHLLFSTLHTNDAPGAVTRLLEIGVENFLLSSTLLGVLAQRLVRVICTGCKEEIRPDERLLNAMGLSNDEAADLHFFAGKGCEECRYTGYKGRIGIFEYLPMDSEVKAEIMKGSSTEAIREAGIDKGMITLRQDGWFKVLRGITTISEVLRVTVEK
jgi:general secretion pathway protein E